MASAAFKRAIQLNLDKFSPEAAKALHIDIARRVLRGILANQDEQPKVIIKTDGQPATTEDSVRPYGVITYVFQRLPAVGQYAIATARELSPVQSGAYKKAWFLLADGKEVSEDSIPADARELLLINDQPYARKIERRGARIVGVPPGIVEKTRQIVLRRYKNFTIVIEYVTLSRGYKLKTPLRRRGRTEHELSYPALRIYSKY